MLAQLSPGLDNCTFVGDARLFVSNFTGEITEILPGGTTRAALPGGLNWPLDLAVGADGALYIADGTYFYGWQPGGEKQTAGMLFTPGYPGFLRGLDAVGPGEFLVTTANGEVARYRPETSETEVLASGFDQLYGVALAPDGIVLSSSRALGGCWPSARRHRCACRSASRPGRRGDRTRTGVLVGESVPAGS